MNKLLSFLAATFFAASAFADNMPISHCDQMVPFGYPKVSEMANPTPLCRIAYFVEHDNEHKIPFYSAELLLKENLNGAKTKRVNAFKADPDLHPHDRSELADYDKAYDRGHMTPFEDAHYDSTAALQTFYLSNMVPQNLHLNRGLWRKIENQTRSYAMKAQEGVYVITGPVIEAGMPVIGENNVAVPNWIFKVVIDKATMQGVGYLVPNDEPKAGDSPEKFKVTIREVEQRTGINFTPKLVTDAFKDQIGSEFK